MTCAKRRAWWVRTAIRTLIAAAVLTLIGNVVFVAADQATNVGQTIPSLSWIQLVDHKGIGLWNYELAINFKSDVFDPGASMSAMFTEFLWRGYLGCTAVSIWFIDWVLSFDWLTIVINPLIAVGDALRDVISRFGLAPAFLMVAAFVGALFIMRGKIARGVYEMLMGAFIVALSATALSNPIQIVAGPGGWIYQARDHTLELVAAMGNQAQTDQNTITSELITTFVRQPVQLVSFGEILDGTGCESVYDDTLRNGPYGYESNIRDAVRNCNQAAGAYADTPNAGMVTSAFIQSPAGLIVLLIAILIGGTVMLSLVTTVLASLKAVINIVLAVLPGGSRRPLAQTFAEMFTGIATFVFAMFFLGVYLMVIQSVFRAHEGQPSKAFAVMVIVMVLGLIAFMRYRKSLKAATARLANWMSQRPGAAAPRPLAPAGHGAQWMKAAGVYGAGRVLASPQGRAAIKNTAMVGAAALTGNPALASRVLLNSAAATRVKRGLGKTVTRPPAAVGGPSGGYVAFSGRATRPAPTAPPTTPGSTAPLGSTSRTPAQRRTQSHDDSDVLEGVIVGPTEGPQPDRLPMRRTRVLAAPPTRPTTLRPSQPRPQLPPSKPAGRPGRPTQHPIPPSKPTGPARTMRRPQQEPPPARSSTPPASPRATRALRRPQRRSR